MKPPSASSAKAAKTRPRGKTRCDVGHATKPEEYP